MHNWITWWARAQRGMGLLPRQCPKKIDIVIHDIPDCKHIRFQFGTGYDTQTVIIKNVYCYGEESYKNYPVTFYGKTSYKISPQENIITDEICMHLLPFQDIHLVYEIETENHYQCVSGFELQSYDSLTSSHSLIYLLKSIEVSGSSLKGCICAFGDSITEQGYWSEPLAKLLKQKGYALLQLGISGNRLLRKLDNVNMNQQLFTNICLEKQCFGKAGIKRFKDDVLTCHHIAGVIIAIGVNDLYQPGTFCADIDEFPDVEDMIEGYLLLKKSIDNIPIWVLGITSFLGADSSNLDKEKVRCEINALLTHRFQTVITFDEWLLNNKGQIKSEYHHGDYLHPNQKAGEIMSQMIIKKMEV